MKSLYEIIKNVGEHCLDSLDSITNILCFCLFHKNITKYNNYLVFTSKIKKTYNFEMCILKNIDSLISILKTNTYIEYDDILGEIFNLILHNKEFTKLAKVLKYHYMNRHLFGYMFSDILDIKDKSVLCLSSQAGEFNNLPSTNVDQYDLNKNYYLWTSLANEIINKPVKIQNTDYIHDDCINKNYDVILCNIPQGIKNITHASCCKRIKDLKIRGTKSEPLILQLIMTSLNNNGVGCIIVPNNLLYNNSKQHVETRQYLIDNFNVTKIITICSTFLYDTTYNCSIMYFEKTTNTKKISFEKIELENNIVTNTKLFDVTTEEIINKSYNLYYEKYITIDVPKKDIEYKLKDVVEVVNTQTTKLDNHYITIPTYINNKTVELHFDTFNLEKDRISLIVKDEDKCLQKYFNYYFYQVIKPNLYVATTGKLKKIDIDLLLDINIHIPSLHTQNIMIKYFDINFNLIDTNNRQIERYNSLKNQYINLMINNSNKIALKNIFKIESKCKSDNTITIQKNSHTAGTVCLSTENNLENPNMYYLNKINNYNDNLAYILLKNKERELNSLARLTKSHILNRTNLEDFEIANLSDEIQQKIIEQCKKYDSICENLHEVNNSILNSDIIKDIYTIENS